MAPLTMYDAIAVGDFKGLVNDNDPNAALAAYCDADFAGDWLATCKAYPKLAAAGRIISIATRLTTIARIMDYETGNPCYGDPAGVIDWIVTMRSAHKVYRPGVYANLADMGAIQKEFDARKLVRSDYVLWVADWNGPGEAQKLLDQGFDIVQDQTTANHDVDLFKAAVFLVAPIAPKPVKKPLVAKLPGFNAIWNAGFQTGYQRGYQSGFVTGYAKAS